jgi:hypothetical protein
MSYPPPVYRGSTGDLTASCRAVGHPRYHRTITESFFVLMRDRSAEDRQAFFERHDTYWV